MANDATQLLNELSQKCGPNEELTVIIAGLASAWAEMAARLAIAEGKLAVVGGNAASSLQRLGTAMKQLETDTRQNDAKLADLHRDIVAKLEIASQLSSKADATMKDVLQTYQDFNGNVTQLKKSVAGLAKTALNSVAPGASAIVDDKLEKLLGVE